MWQIIKLKKIKIFIINYYFGFSNNLPEYKEKYFGVLTYEQIVNRYVKIKVKECNKFHKSIFQKKSFKEKVLQYRAFLVFFSFLISLAFIYFINIIFNFGNWFVDNDWLKSASAGTIFSMLFGLPIAFVIWYFRDHNICEQINNSRKDINLKDFQKLAEWVSGQHLPEDKIIEVTENNNKKTTLEHFSPPPNHQSYSRRMGAESLQVSAIYQLQAFINGEYGDYFRQPSFQLLKSIWDGFVEEWLLTNPLPTRSISNHPTHGSWAHGWENAYDWCDEEAIQEWKNKLVKHFSKPLGCVLQKVILSNNGHMLIGNPIDLLDIKLVGLGIGQYSSRALTAFGTINTGRYLNCNLFISNLDLNGCNIQGAYLLNSELQGVNFSYALLQGSDFRFSNMQKGFFYSANLQCSDMRKANLQFSNFTYANISNSKLCGAQLQNSILHYAKLQASILSSARLQNTDFTGANLMCVDLSDANITNANFKSADLRGVIFSNSYSDNRNDINFSNCKINNQTKFGRLREENIKWLETKDEDWIDGDKIREEWVLQGAINVDKK